MSFTPFGVTAHDSLIFTNCKEPRQEPLQENIIELEVRDGAIVPKE